MNVAAFLHRAVASALLSGGLLAANAAAQTIDPASDGWHTWRVAASATAPAWCCLRWNTGRPVPQVCDLDSRTSDHNYSSMDVEVTGQIQIYALFDSGVPVRIRTLSPRCEVKSDSAITDLGTVSADASVAWLERIATPGAKLNEDIHASLSVHQGDRALRALITVIENRTLDMGDRRSALFWLVQSDSELVSGYMDSLFASR